MAKVSFAAIQQNNSNGGGNSGSNFNDQNSVGFFSLKNDGEEAVVRFIEDSTDFEILSTHSITLNGKYRSISCVRGDHDPVQACPLCEAGTQLRNRLFVKMIQYIKNPDGTITAKPVMWERAASMANTLYGYLENYGPLSEIVCKIVRHGAPGNLQTTYEIIPNLSKSIYRDDLYPCDKTPFQNYSVLGRSVLDKTFDEIKQYMTTGEFPMRQRAEESSGVNTASQAVPTNPAMPDMSAVPESISQPNPAYTAPAQSVPAGFTQVAEPAKMPWESAQPQTAPAAPQRMPWENANTSAAPGVGGVARPTRYY